MDNLNRAFSFPFKDPQWVSKFVIAALFALLALLGIGFFFLAGYLVQITQRVIRKEEYPLPEWNDIGTKFVLGAKLIIVYVIYLLPILLLLIPLIPLAIAGEYADQSGFLGLAVLVYTFGFTLLALPYSIVLTLAGPIIAYRLALNERMSDALDIGAIISDFTRNWQNVLIVVLIAIGLQSFAGLGIILLIVGVIFTILYSYFVPAYLSGALYLDTVRKGASS